MGTATKSRCILAALASVGFLYPAIGQAPNPVLTILAQMASTNVTVRSAAFYNLIALAPSDVSADAPAAGVLGLVAVYPNDSAQLIAALNQLLITENSNTTRSALSGGPNDETPGDFYADVVEAVVALKSPTSIAPLAGAIATGNMATTALASYGTTSLPYVLPLIYSSNLQVKDGAGFTLTEMQSPQFSALVSNPTSQSQIRAAFQRLIASFSSLPGYAFMAGPYRTALSQMPAVPQGDLNGDGVVNCADLAIIKASFGKSVGQSGFDIRADVNGDGVVNILDLSAEARLMPAGTVCN